MYGLHGVSREGVADLFPRSRTVGAGFIGRSIARVGTILSVAEIVACGKACRFATLGDGSDLGGQEAVLVHEEHLQFVQMIQVRPPRPTARRLP